MPNESPSIPAIKNDVHERIRIVGLRIALSFSLLFILVIFVFTPVNPRLAYLPTFAIASLAAIALLSPGYRNICSIGVVGIPLVSSPVLMFENGLIPAPLFLIGLLFSIMMTSGKTRLITAVLWGVTPLLLPLLNTNFDANVWIRVSITSVVLTPSLLYIVATLESSMIRNEKLAGRMKETIERQDRIYATIGHELRTPASAINMMLKEPDFRSDPAMHEKVLEMSEHLLTITDDMRTILDTGYRAEGLSTIQTIDLFSLVKRTVGGLTYLAEKHGISIEYSVQHAELPGYNGPMKPLRQVFLNLVRNAIVHSHGSNVSIHVRKIQETGRMHGFVLEVIDDGKGIPDKDRLRLFSPFERGDTNAEGVGIGLALSRKLAREFLHGDVSHSHNPAGGSIFQFTFLLEQIDADQPAEGSNSAFENTRILFVEDTPILRTIGSALLERSGANVVTAENGADALELFDAQPFDIVLTDIMMPVMDGYELVRKLRERGFKGPVAGLTGATLGHEASDLVAAGADFVLAKPLTMEVLEEKLAEI